MKSWKLLYFSSLRFLSLWVALFWAHPSISIAAETPAITILKEHYHYQKFVHNLNQVTFQALESCLCQKAEADLSLQPLCKEVAPIQSFKRQYYANGEFIQNERTCEQLIDEVLRSPIKENFQAMRASLALSQAASKSDQTLLAEYGSDNSLKFTSKIRHPLMEILTGIKIADLNPIENQEEIHKILDVFNEFRDKQCFAEVSPRLKNKNEKLELIQICQEATKKTPTLLNEFNSATDFEKYAMRSNILKGIESALRNKRREFYQTQFKEYIKLITKHPILLMVSSEKPSDVELLSAIKVQKNYKGYVAYLLEQIEHSTKVTEDKFYKLALYTNGPSKVAMKIAKKNAPYENWEKAKVDVETGIQILKQYYHGRELVLQGSGLIGCLVVARGPILSACTSTLMALSIGSDFIDFRSTLLDVMLQIEPNFSQENDEERVVLEKLIAADATVLSNLVFILPGLGPLNKVQKLEKIKSIIK